MYFEYNSVNSGPHVFHLDYQVGKRLNWKTVCIEYLPESKMLPNDSKLVAELEKHFKGDKWLHSWFNLNNGIFLEHFCNKETT